MYIRRATTKEEETLSIATKGTDNPNRRCTVQSSIVAPYVLVACRDNHDLVAHLEGSTAGRVAGRAQLLIDRVAYMQGSQEGREACAALLDLCVTANADRTIRITHKHVDANMVPLLVDAGFKQLVSGWTRQAGPRLRNTHPLAVVAADEEKTGFVVDMETESTENTDFRRVLYTGENLQLVLMSLKPDEEIGMEVHKDNDQFFRVDGGSGVCSIGGKETAIKNGAAFVIPAGSEHNVTAGADGLKLYAIYGPPHHKDGTIHKTKAEAERSKEEFDGVTTEE